MRLLVIGANGQLGADFVYYASQLDYETVGLAHEDLEVSDRDAVFRVLGQREFDVIVNTTAYQGPAAYADTHPRRFYEINTYAPYHLAEFAREHGKEIVHFSTDFVFSGNSPPGGSGFTEDDLPRPANLYAASKLAGEAAIPLAVDAHYIFRVASLYGASGCRAKSGTNFVKLVVARLSTGTPMQVVDDIRSSPTSTKSVVVKTLQVLRSGNFGLYHLAGSGSCTWYDLAVEVARQKGLREELIERISSKRMVQEVVRGSNTALANRRLIESGLGDMPPWQENLAEYLRERTM